MNSIFFAAGPSLAPSCGRFYQFGQSVLESSGGRRAYLESLASGCLVSVLTDVHSIEELYQKIRDPNESLVRARESLVNENRSLLGVLAKG